MGISTPSLWKLNQAKYLQYYYSNPFHTLFILIALSYNTVGKLGWLSTSTVKILSEVGEFIRIINFHRDGGGPLSEATSARKVIKISCSSNISLEMPVSWSLQVEDYSYTIVLVLGIDETLIMHFPGQKEWLYMVTSQLASESRYFWAKWKQVKNNVPERDFRWRWRKYWNTVAYNKFAPFLHKVERILFQYLLVDFY